MTQLLHLTDTHLFGDPGARYRDTDTRASLRQVLEMAAAEADAGADAILLSGDISEDGSAESYAFIAETLAPLGIPVGCVPGNHDRPSAMGEAFSVAPFQYTGAMNCGRWRVLLLDSHWPGQVAGRLSDASMQLLREQLARPGDEFILLCLHHHPVTIDSAWLDQLGLQDAARLFSMIDGDPRVRCVLWGHIHQHYAATRNGVRLFATPSTCRQFMPRKADFGLDRRGPAARRLLLHEDGTIETHLIGYADD